ncbi:Ca2+-binding protein, RTX toxin-related [Roseivivax marinus]|nr:Ca2+-binding protein, RTX toxin-related [Roseivivax marinus]
MKADFTLASSTDFDIISLGLLPRIDTTEGNDTAENASALLGLHGSAYDPLFDRIQSLSAVDTSTGDLGLYDSNNSGGYDQFSVDGGPARNFDSVAAYNATLVYADGTTATITATVFQDTDGNTFLAPELTANADQDALTAKPILMVSLDSVAAATGDMNATREQADFGTAVDGTTGNDSISLGYADADGDAVTTGVDAIEGGAGNDTISGGGGGDFIDGGAGDDSLSGGAERDILMGGTGADTIDGGGGDDYILYGSGDDVVHGGSGNDYIDDQQDVRLAGFNYIDAGAGNDTVWAGLDDDTVHGGSGNDNISGEEGNDSVTGGAGNDTIDGGSGTDTAVYTGAVGEYLFGRGPSGQLIVVDAVAGRDGTDYLIAVEYLQFDGTTYRLVQGDDADNLSLQGVDDGVPSLVIGHGGNDNALGYATPDYMAGGTGNDTLTGGAGNDTLVGEDGNDSLLGGDGQDSLVGGAGQDSLYGEAGNDYVDGGAGDDSITGGAGDDTLTGGTGIDSLWGDSGSDTFIIHDTDGTGFVYAGEDGDPLPPDTDTLDFEAAGAGGADVTFGGWEYGTYTFGAATGQFYEVEAVDGSQNADSIDATLSPADMSLAGNGGDDTILGGSGADTISGDAGNDSLSGGDRDDLVTGGAGNDSLGGGAGDDVLTGGDGDDVFTYQPGDGVDTITDFGAGNTGTIRDGDTTNNDRIELAAFYDSLVELRADFEDDGLLNQSNSLENGGLVDYSDNARFGAGDALIVQGADRTAFTTESTGVVCFTAGTRILTPSGEVLIETLRPGDLVMTEDAGAQPVLWMGRTSLDAERLEAEPHLRPVRLRPHLTGAARDLLVSPQHAMLVEDRLVRATHMVKAGWRGARVAEGRKQVEYIHLLLPRHHLVRAEGVVSESMYPGPQALAGLDFSARRSLRAVLPNPAAYGPPVREIAAFRDLSDIPGRLLSPADAEPRLTA